MSVMIETSFGDIVVDLYTEEAPNACTNFLKLCKAKYYNNCPVHTIQKDFVMQTGDPQGDGKGGSSVWGLLEGPSKRFFKDEVHPSLTHSERGVLSTHNLGPHLNNSAFFITLNDQLNRLDKKHTVFGQVVEGEDVLDRFNHCLVDKDTGRPKQPVRIRHTVILDDPFPDPEGLEKIIPDRSPTPIGDDNMEDENEGLTAEEIAEKEEIATAKSRAEVLVAMGDIPDAEVAPPENVLFVCKLNPVTEEEDLETIFSQFGKVKSCEVIRDWKTGDSLQYAFIEFAERESCERAYFKMDNVLIDDRRIHVNFCQSIPKNFQRKYAEDMAKNDKDRAKGGNGRSSSRFAYVGGVRSKQSIGSGNERQRGAGGQQQYRLVFDSNTSARSKGDYEARKRKRDSRSRERDRRGEADRRDRGLDRDRDRERRGREGRRDRDRGRDRERVREDRHHHRDSRGDEYHRRHRHEGRSRHVSDNEGERRKRKRE